MKLICCIDDNGGMMFNRRRQSRDREVVRDILESAGGRTVWISAYSKPLFGDVANVKETESDPVYIPAEDFYFAETPPNNDMLASVSELIIYKWNRSYPSDQKCLIRFDEWKMQSTAEFPGFSHEKITKEIYLK